ncbi:MAG: hypothetical protein ACK2UK_11240 [Candidatus Promineifilaceae bacterium]
MNRDAIWAITGNPRLAAVSPGYSVQPSPSPLRHQDQANEVDGTNTKAIFSL